MSSCLWTGVSYVPYPPYQTFFFLLFSLNGMIKAQYSAHVNHKIQLECTL